MPTWIAKVNGPDKTILAEHINALQDYKLDTFANISTNPGGSIGVGTVTATCSPGGTPNTEYFGFQADCVLTTGNNAGSISGLWAIGRTNGAADSNITEGLRAVAYFNSTDTSGNQSLYGARAYVANTSTGTVQHMIAIKANAPTNSGGGTVNYNWGLYVADQTLAGAVTAAIHIEGLGLENCIAFGNDDDQAYSRIYQVAAAQLMLSPVVNYNIRFALNNTIGGDATTLALQCMNDARDAWVKMAIESNTLSINAVTGAATVLGGNLTVATGFGCNGASAKTAAASGGALAAYVTGAFGLDSGANMSALHALVVAMRAALVANGIMS